MSSTTSPASGVPGEESPPPRIVEDCLGVLQLLSDGTVKRVPPPLVLHQDDAALPDDDEAPVKWKDVVYDEANKLSLRMFVPSAGGGGGRGEKLPVLVFFHGGGFVIGTFAMPGFHAWCLRLAAELPAVVLSADYRLAPEHRLPAAHDDAESVFSWLRAQAAEPAGADTWLAESADFNRVFVCGDSAGGNIAHHIAVKYGSGRLALAPARLAGCVMLWPYFGGEERTPSEAASRDAGDFMGTVLFDQMWRLALPAGATRDHPAANPFGPGSVPLHLHEADAFPPALVVEPEKDVLRDRVADYVARMKAAGKQVELVAFVGQGHGFFVFEPWGEASDELVRVIRRFVRCGL